MLKLYEIIVERDKGVAIGDVFWLTEDQAAYAARVLKNAQDGMQIADHQVEPLSPKSFAALQKWIDEMHL